MEYQSNFALDVDIDFGNTLDPFSEQYRSSMIELYTKIAGRKLDQSSGELFSVPKNIECPNPYASKDVPFIAKHGKAILDSLLAAQMPANASILDMGCGWGLSSEMIGFTGAQVTGVDINPDFIDLATQRCRIRNIPFTGVTSSFEDLNLSSQFDGIFFYECLHHAVDLNILIPRLKAMLKESGTIIFAGEPINNLWWKYWGLRLDAMSVYCIRKFGWFESGWSEHYLLEVFKRHGLKLVLHKGIGLDQGDIGCARFDHSFK